MPTGSEGAHRSTRDQYRAARDGNRTEVSREVRERLRSEATAKISDKLGIDRGVADALTTGRDSEGRPLTARERAGAVANAGVTTGLIYVGVPPELAKRLTPLIFKVTAGVVSFSLLILMGLVGGIAFDERRDPIATNEAYEEIDEELRRNVGVAANTYRIPVRVLIAIAGVQTSYGRYSPYDDIDRDPSRKGPGIVEKKGGNGEDVSFFPSAKPAIGNPANPDEGVGMYLVKPGAAARAGVDPQNVLRTSLWLASLMRDEADRLRKSGVVEPDSRSVNYAQADDFWGRVVAALPLVDVFGQSIGCAAPAGVTRIDSIISALWTCELDRVTGVSIPTVTLAGEVPVLSFDNDGHSATRLVREALGVAWQWGQLRRPGATTWEEISDIPCNEREPLAGVMPIDRKTAASLGIDARCDTPALVGALARAVIGRLTLDPSAIALDPTRPWSAETRGWDLVGWALGDEATAERFATTGPQQPYAPSNQCRNATYDYLTMLSRNVVLREPFVSAAAASGTDREGLLENARSALLKPGAGNMYRDARCNTFGRTPNASEWLNYVGNLANELVHVAEEGRLANSVTTALPELVTFQTISGLGTNTTAGSSLPIPGRDAAVERLSPTPILLDMPPAQTGGYGTAAFALWTRILNETLRIGGILADDPRAGVGAGAGGVGISLRRVDPSSLSVIQKFTDGGLVEAMRCTSDSWSETPIMSPEYATRWSALCNAAQAAGVDLPINSSWRSNSEQISIWERFGDALAARPGFSNHQKGYALDIAIGGSEVDHEGSANSAFAFLHSVVGCVDVKAKSFTALPAPMLMEEYVSELDGGAPPCTGELLPIKRVQTFGLVPLCTAHVGEDWSDRDVLTCSKRQYMKGTDTRREAWHLDYGVIFLQTGFAADCNGTTPINPADKRSVAIAVKTVWLCELQANGFGSLAAVNGPSYPATQHFANLAEQVSSEALVVAYCESGFQSSVGDKYVGVFQMGEPEMEAYGGGASRIDALANIRAAARYFVASYKNNQGRGWAGWGPWAVVNTNYWETNRGVLRPVIGRFPSTRPDTEGEFGPDLPKWAIDPTTYWPPKGGCGDAYAGKPWPDTPELPMSR